MKLEGKNHSEFMSLVFISQPNMPLGVLENDLGDVIVSEDSTYYR